MEAVKSYKDKLLDPRWQKKRLEVLERDEWQCQGCGAHDKTLHVHHACYIRGKDPWDIDSRFLVTLCPDCHDLEEGRSPVIDGDYPNTFDGMFLASDIDYLQAQLYWAIKKCGKTPREMFLAMNNAIRSKIDECEE